VRVRFSTTANYVSLVTFAVVGGLHQSGVVDWGGFMATSAVSARQLEETMTGRVIRPGDPDYDQARAVFSGSIDRHPALIARVAGSDDVREVIAFARGNGMELAVRSGGHSYVGHGVTEGGVVLDLREMKALEIDPVGRTAWVETGVTAGEYTVRAGEFGLATGFGDTGSVGIGGITLAGGIGFLVRKYGMTIDSLQAAELITADGEVLRVDHGSHPDLFWAIRGGGGNFGVVTRFKFRLHEVQSFVGGMLALPASPEVLLGFLDEAAQAPNELSTIANVMLAPPMPFLPEELHGKLVVLALMAYAGDIDVGEKVLQRFRDLAKPLADLVKPMTYPEIYLPDDESYRPVASSMNLFTDSIGSSEAATIIDRVEASTATMSATQIRVLGGAMAEVPADETAFAHRQEPLMVNVAALYERPEQAAEYDPWVRDLARDLGHGLGRAYVGFVGDEGDEGIRRAYPDETRQRLAEVKRRYDPTNLFRLNQNIRPI
jgi:FAD/FMN-containing dehydrogenase